MCLVDVTRGKSAIRLFQDLHLMQFYSKYYETKPIQMSGKSL